MMLLRIIDTEPAEIKLKGALDNNRLYRDPAL